jgi:Tol biopolymer transport system component/DNA-binding winged helix-turn-helix (wHTH) protein
MSRKPDCSQNWAFGAFELEGRTAELRRNGVAVRLQEQPSQLLLFLLQHAGQIVTREDLRLQLWPADTFVDFDHALNTAVMKLREALGDSSENPLYIQTLPRKGYRFVAPVAMLPSINGHSNLAATVAPSPRMAASSATNESLQDLAIADAAIAYPHDAVAPPENAIATLPEKPGAMRKNPPRHAVSLAVASAALLLLPLAVGGVLLYRGSMTSKPAAVVARSLTRITFDEGLQADPTWSPDGRYIAYSANRGGVTNIWMQQISVGDPIQITSGPGPNWQPDWSPDGRYIAYRSDAGSGGLFVIPAIGGAGQERKIASFGYNPRWSPDGTQILFRGENDQFPWVDRTSEFSQFYVVGLDGGQPARVLSDFFRQHSSFDAISAEWHPDGKRVTVWIDDPARSGPTPQFWTTPLYGGPAVYSEMEPQIQQKFSEVAGPSGNECVIDSKFTWSPSGRALYLERTFRGARSLWRLNIEPGTLRATSVDQLTSGGGLDTGPAVSPDGKKLAFTAASGNVSAWLYPFDANRGRIIGSGSSITSPGMSAWVTTVTRDGSELAFSGVRAGETRLWVKSLPRGRELPLFVDGFIRSAPQWSPDGRRLAYFRWHNPGEGQFVIWSAESRQEEPLTSPAIVESENDAQMVYDWSPDGRSLLVVKLMGALSPESSSVWRIPVSAAPRAESKERMIISDPAYDLYQAHASPDGRWIVFEAVTRERALTGPSSLYVMRASGGPWLPIIDKNWADKPRWSPDGKIIYFLWGRGSFLNVWGIHFDPKTGRPVGKPFQVTSLNSPDLMIPGYVGNVEISVSRKNLVSTLAQLSGGIWVLDNVDH